MAMRSIKLPASIWLTNAGVKDVGRPPIKYPKISGVKGDHYDVVVVGGGIFGISTAYELKQAGKRVALLEGRTIGTGTTGYSTAKLSAQQGPLYQSIKQQRGAQAAKDYYDINMNGINKAEAIAKQLNLKCEMERRPHMTWTGVAENVGTIKSEFEVCKELGIPARLLDAADLLQELPATVHPQLAICFDDMIQFNSYEYCNELAQHIAGDGSAVFEDSRVTSVTENVLSAVNEKKPAHDIVLEDNGSSLTSDYVILATHLPIMDRSLHFAVVQPSRSHCVAVRVKDGTSPMRMMSVNADMPMRSLRTDVDNNVIVISGDKVEMGDRSDTYECYEDLERWAYEHWEVEEVVARWSAMDYKSMDHVPYLGYLHPGTKTILTATGFSKWGLAFSVGGAEVINDLVHGRPNRLADTVNAQRWNTVSQYQNLTMESAHTASHLVSDKIKNALTLRSVKDLQPGEGGICKHGIKNVGAYRDENGKLHVVEPVCTHLGCDVIFNQGDRIWDCPCHGSQFAVDGAVIHGPAVKPLCQVKDIEW